jgi:hypothetical protein
VTRPQEPPLDELLAEAREDTLSSGEMAQVEARLFAAGLLTAPDPGAPPPAPGTPPPASAPAVPSVLLPGLPGATGWLLKLIPALSAVGLGAGLWAASGPAPAPLQAATAPVSEVAGPAASEVAGPAASEVPGPVASEVPRPVASGPTETLPPPSARRPPPLAGTSGGPSLREGTLLLEARRVLDTNPAQALALVRQHAREFPRSQLAAERARLQAEAERRGALAPRLGRVRCTCEALELFC